MSPRALFCRHERSLLLIGYAAVLGLIAWLGIVNGGLFGLLCICLFVIVHLAFAVARGVVGWGK